MQTFIEFFDFLHWWKSCLLIKNNIAKYYPCTCFPAHKQPDGEFKKLKSWNDLIKPKTCWILDNLNSNLRAFLKSCKQHH